MQVSEAIFRYGRELGVKVVPIYGGQPIYRQLQALDRGVHVVVATPGRALDHIGRGSLPLDEVKTVILDEADEMLDMGFADDIESILHATPAEPQTVMFSATMPARINAIAREYQQIRCASRSAASDKPGNSYPPERIHGAAVAQAGRARTHPRHRGTRRNARVLPHTHRGRPADRDDERSRLSRRGIARRHGSAATRPCHGPPS